MSSNVTCFCHDITENCPFGIKQQSRLATGQWFSPGPAVSSTNKTDRHDITEILLKVVLKTINQTNKQANELLIKLVFLTFKKYIRQIFPGTTDLVT
jgi:hypothetical protein